MALDETTPLVGKDGPGRAQLSHAKQRTIGSLSLIAIMYFSVAGGPEGTETMIQTGGPLPTFIGIIALGIFLAVPACLMTVELASAFPENGGIVLWARAAFGDTAAGTAGLLQFIVTCVDSALYPGLFVGYLAQTMQTEFSWMTLWFLQGLFIAAIAILNLAGVSNVGHGSVGMLAFLLLPFVLITMIAFTGVFTGTTITGWTFEVSHWGDVVNGDRPLAEWSVFVIVLMWNMGWWERASVMSGEVKDVETVFPSAIAWTVVLVVLNYMLPLMAFTGLDGDYISYDNGYFIPIARHHGGDVWGAWLGLSQCVSAAGLFTAGVSTNAFMLCGLGEQGMVPSVCAHRMEGTRAPVVAIAIATILPVCMVFVGNFQSILAIDIIFYSLSLMLEIAALIYLRVKCPDLKRRFRIPLETPALIAMYVPAVLLCLFIVFTAKVEQLMICGGVLVGGILLLLAAGEAKKRYPEWFECDADVVTVQRMQDPAP